MKAPRRPIHAVTLWVRRQPPKMKAFLTVVSAIVSLVLIYVMVHDHDQLFVAAEAVHAIGIGLLIYKLMKERSCAGLSLKSQELTASFLAARLYCSIFIEYDVHTFLDFATLIATLWVIYMIRFKLKASYMGDKDNFKVLYLVVPCIFLAIPFHPSPPNVSILSRILWAFCVYLEAVCVLPQVRVMQNTKIVEPFTAHYVFSLGVARFLNCAHWVLKLVLKGGGLGLVVGWVMSIMQRMLTPRGRLLITLGAGYWPPMVFLAEIVQTFVLADFCYYYVKSILGGQLAVRLPAEVV